MSTFPKFDWSFKIVNEIWKVIIHLQDLSDLSLTNPIVLVFLFIFALGHSWSKEKSLQSEWTYISDCNSYNI